eukprot:8509136-Pyramimonas_sp.AAC.1
MGSERGLGPLEPLRALSEDLTSVIAFLPPTFLSPAAPRRVVYPLVDGGISERSSSIFAKSFARCKPYLGRRANDRCLVLGDS